MISEKKCEELKAELDSCGRPFFLFDDDPDGFTSFLLLYRYKREGKGIPVKSSSVNTKFIEAIKRYEPDKIFILDVPVVDEAFVEAMEKMKLPIVWLDHHAPPSKDMQQRISYFSPKLEDEKDSSSTAINAYAVVKEPKDIWIAMIGAVGDWQIPPYKDEFCKAYPELMDTTINKPEVALFGTELGKLVKLVSFMLKGTTNQVMKCVKIMTRIENPDEILKQTSSRGAFLMKHSSKVQEKYDALYKEASDSIKEQKEKVAVFAYPDQKTSFTKEISNELLYNFPEKILMIAREKSGEMKISLRSAGKPIIGSLKKALAGVQGYGGGHDHACGACVKKRDFETFIEQFRKEVA